MAMTHPHIAAVYDYGVGNGGIPFLVMDYMPGQTLEQLKSDRCIDLTQGITQTGEIFGSPSYMAPEQCKGETVDERTDIHALGVLLYEAISGQKPFQGKNSFAVLLNVVSAKPAACPEYIKLPPDCISTVLKCIEKDPDDRYQNASELSHDLQKIREGKRITSSFAVFMHSFILTRRSKTYRLGFSFGCFFIWTLCNIWQQEDNPEQKPDQQQRTIALN